MLPFRVLLASAAISLILLGVPITKQVKADPVANSEWLKGLEDLKKGGGDSDKVVQGCVLELYAELHGRDDEWQIRQTIAGMLEVANVAAFKVFCSAFVHAVVGNRLTPADLVHLSDESDPSEHSRAIGRLLREVFYAHRDLQRIQRQGGSQS